jgi:hypothetical protein
MSRDGRSNAFACAGNDRNSMLHCRCHLHLHVPPMPLAVGPLPLSARLTRRFHPAFIPDIEHMTVL